MANFNIPENPEYSEEIRKFETSDPVHADLMNAVIEKLVNNEAFLKKTMPLTGICNTAKNLAAKEVICPYFQLNDGVRIMVTFANGSNTNYMTLNVNGTGGVAVWFPVGTNRTYNNEIISKYIVSGCAYEFIYQAGITPKWVYCGITNDIWATSRNINGMLVDGSVDRVNYGVCSTAAAIAAKVVDCPGFHLIEGAEITVKFINDNAASNATLNVNGTGAKSIRENGNYILGSLRKGFYTFRYDGTNYESVITTAANRLARSTRINISGDVNGYFDFNGDGISKNVRLSRKSMVLGPRMGKYKLAKISLEVFGSEYIHAFASLKVNVLGDCRYGGIVTADAGACISDGVAEAIDCRIAWEYQNGGSDWINIYINDGGLDEYGGRILELWVETKFKAYYTITPLSEGATDGVSNWQFMDWIHGDLPDIET